MNRRNFNKLLAFMPLLAVAPALAKTPIKGEVLFLCQRTWWDKALDYNSFQDIYRTDLIKNFEGEIIITVGDQEYVVSVASPQTGKWKIDIRFGCQVYFNRKLVAGWTL